MFTKADLALGEIPVFHHVRAVAAGLSDDQIRYRLRAGTWIEVLPRVYRHAAVPADAATMRRAALLWAGDEAALSHRSAGSVLGLDRVNEERPEITVPPAQYPRSPLVVVHRMPLADDDVVECGGLRCTSVVRTIIDLSAVLDEASLESALESARRRYGTEVRAIEACLRTLGGPGRHGREKLRKVLGAGAGSLPCESVLEVKVARLLRASKLPAPTRQFWIRVFGRRYRVDFAWPEFRIALECDGRAFHEFQKDRTKWRQLGASGWRVLPVTWRDVTTDWSSVLAELASALAS